jgi:hypothetical protein
MGIVWFAGAFFKKTLIREPRSFQGRGTTAIAVKEDLSCISGDQNEVMQFHVVSHGDRDHDQQGGNKEEQRIRQSPLKSRCPDYTGQEPNPTQRQE